MAKKQLVYVVRGLNEHALFPNPVGTIESILHSFETTVTSLPAAVSLMTLNDHLSIDLTDLDTPIIELDLSIKLDLTNKLDVKAVKSNLRDVIKRWAEKCRVRNFRGFRTSAIRTPVFEYKSDHTVMNVKILLSKLIVYSKNSSRVSLFKDIEDFNDVIQDLKLLFNQLQREVPLVTEVKYRYTGFDSGVLI